MARLIKCKQSSKSFVPARRRITVHLFAAVTDVVAQVLALLSEADSAALGLRPQHSATKQLAAVNVNSYLGKEKDTVTLAVRFASLPDAVNYPPETVLVAAAKQIQVKIANSGYKK